MSKNGREKQIGYGKGEGCRRGCCAGRDRPFSRADTFDEANAETGHMIIVRLVERTEIDCIGGVGIRLRISARQ